jgi:hypothetical protein
MAMMTATTKRVTVVPKLSAERDLDRFRTLFATEMVTLCVKGLSDDKESTCRVSSLSIDLNDFQTLRAMGKLDQDSSHILDLIFASLFGWTERHNKPIEMGAATHHFQSSAFHNNNKRTKFSVYSNCSSFSAKSWHHQFHELDAQQQ